MVIPAMKNRKRDLSDLLLEDWSDIMLDMVFRHKILCQIGAVAYIWAIFPVLFNNNTTCTDRSRE